MPKHLGSGPQGLRRPRFSFFRFTFQTARGRSTSKSRFTETKWLPTTIGSFVTSTSEGASVGAASVPVGSVWRPVDGWVYIRASQTCQRRNCEICIFCAPTPGNPLLRRPNALKSHQYFCHPDFTRKCWNDRSRRPQSGPAPSRADSPEGSCPTFCARTAFRD